MHFTNLRDDWRTSPAQLEDQLPDRDDYAPSEWSIHYGGGGPYRVTTWADSASLYRGWWGYHTRSDGQGGQVMSDIAYNYGAPPADGVSVATMRLRGERPNGAHWNSNTWGPFTRTYVFPTGPSGPLVPSANQLEAFALMWEQDPLPVRWHSFYPSQNTRCPGDELRQLIADEFWLDYLDDPDGIVRVAGADRYETAALLSSFPFEATDVALVRGDIFPDAVAAAAAAPKVLFTHPNALPQVTFAALTALRPTRIVVVGGTTAVSREVARDAVKAIV